MKLISILFALAGVALMVLGFLCAAMWEDYPMALGAMIGALLAAGFAVLIKLLDGKQVTQ